MGGAELPLLFAIFLDLAGFGMVIPDVQTRLETLGASGLIIGSVLSSYFLVQMLVSPLWGRLSDRVGRKPILVACGALSSASMVAYALAQSPVPILLSRVLAGFAAANVVVAQAYLADTTETEAAREAAMGRVGAAITSGLILGPALGGWLAEVGGNRLLGSVAALAAGLGALWIALAVPHHPPREARRPGKQPAFDLSLLRDVPRLRPLFLLAASAFFALACLEGTFGRLIRLKLGYGPSEFGLIFGYESALGVLVQAVLLAPVMARLGPRALLVAAYVLQGVGLALTPFAPHLTGLFAVSTLFALGAGFANPTLNALSSAATPPSRQGEMFGLLQATRSFGFLLGPILGSLLFDWRPEAPYLLAGGVLMASALLAVVGRAFRSAPVAPAVDP